MGSFIHSKSSCFFPPKFKMKLKPQPTIFNSLGSILCDGGTSRPPSFHSNKNIDVMDILLHYLTADCYFSIFFKGLFF